MPVRNRLVYGALIVLVMALGLASRRYTSVLPTAIVQYAGDMLWATLIFLALGLVVPRWSSLSLAGAALALSYAVELSQIYHAPWIDAVRQTRLGGLIFGFGFLWSDLVCYTVGVALGAALDIWLQKLRKSHP